MSEKHYFQRVKEQSETRFWINNVTGQLMKERWAALRIHHMSIR